MNTEATAADTKAAELIQAEVAHARGKFGNSTEAATSPYRTGGQLLHAASAMASSVIQQDAHSGAFPASPPLVWPNEWDKTYYRDFGSEVANLVVAAAYLQNEIARRLEKGAPSTRVDRPAKSA